MCIRKQTLLHLATLLVLVVACPLALRAETKLKAPPPGALGVSPAEVHAAWAARTAQVRSFEATWQQREFHRSGSLMGAASQRRSASAEPKFPERDRTVSVEGELRLLGDDVFCRRSGPQWITEFNDFVERDQVSSLSDGVVALLSHTSQNRAEPRAQVLPADRFRETRLVANLPLFIALRALGPQGAIDQDGAWSVSPVTAAIDGHTCVVVERLAARYHPELEKGELRETFWVDPARDFCVRRFERTLAGLVELQVQIGYDDPAHAWLPTSWKTVVYGGPEAIAQRQYDGRLLTNRVNGELPRERTRVEFPLGTAVDDLVNQQAWIVLADGRKRMVTDEERERGATYAQLVASEPGQAALPPWQPWRAIAGAGALLLALATLVLRWRVRRTLAPAAFVPAAETAGARWLTILALGASLSLATLAARPSLAAPTVCAGRCHNGIWSAYKQGTIYRMDFITNCKYRAWSTDTVIPYASANACTGGYTTAYYYLVSTTWSHACWQYAPAGDLMRTWDYGGTFEGPYSFQCCTNKCYGTP